VGGAYIDTDGAKPSGDAPVAEVKNCWSHNKAEVKAGQKAVVAAPAATYASGTHLQQQKILDEKYSASIHNRNR
jgi:2-oxoglutarate dehydrogenase E2 component (dihydrolipoamide succinyltransferase)